MALSTTFQGQSILHPGAYSISNVNLQGGFPLTTTGTLLLVGEASGGAPGAVNGFQQFSASEFGNFVSQFISGPLVDAALAAANPSLSANVFGWSNIIVWKTNNSTQASLQLLNASSQEVILVSDANWGVQGNSKSLKILTGSSANQVQINVYNSASNVQEVLPQNASIPQLAIFYKGAGVSASLSIAGASDSAKTLTTTTSVGGAENLSIPLSSYTISTLVSYINSTHGTLYTATLLNNQSGVITPATDLDPISSLNLLEGTLQATTTATLTSGSNQLTAVASVTGIAIGQIAIGSGIPDGALVTAIGTNTVTLNQNVTASAVGESVSFYSQPQLFRLQHEIVDVINQNSKQITAAVAGFNPGVPASQASLSVATSLPLSGGTAGSSANSDFANGFNNSLSLIYDVLVPCVSQDATADITLGVTDPSSSYQIASVIADMDSHLLARASIKNRREAQGIAGFRTNLKANLFAQAETMNLFYAQLAGQDILVTDINGNLTWKQPHVLAAMLAGMRVGVAIGTPLTFKFLNINGLGMDVNPSTGVDGSDFNPLIDSDSAIQAGVTFLEPVQNSFRVVVDNTTYGIDQNFVFNRGSVVQAAIYIAKTVRSQLEAIYVGSKISSGTDKSMLNTIRSIMNDLLAAQIITGTNKLPLGWDPSNTSVVINGNTANISLPVVPVQSLDFVLLTFSLQNIVQSA